MPSNTMGHQDSLMIRLLQTVVRNDSLEIDVNAERVKINLANLHRGIKPLLPFIFGDTNLFHVDTMDYHYRCDLLEINLNNVDKALIIEKLLSYELNVFLTSYFLYENYEKEKILSDFAKKNGVNYINKKDDREYGISLGPQYCCNILQPFLLKHICRYNFDNDSIYVDLKIANFFSDYSKITKEIVNRIKIEEKSISANSTSIVISNVNDFIDKFSKTKIYNFGIVHENDNSQLAFGETWYKDEGSYGFATAGGFNPTPHFPEYGMAIESFGEFHIKIKDLSKVILINSKQNYCTGIVLSDNFEGELSVSGSEFKISSGVWLSITEIINKKIPLRNTIISILDYIKFNNQVDPTTLKFVKMINTDNIEVIYINQ